MKSQKSILSNHFESSRPMFLHVFVVLLFQMQLGNAENMPKLSELLKCRSLCLRQPNDCVDCDVCNSLVLILKHLRCCALSECPRCLSALWLMSQQDCNPELYPSSLLNINFSPLTVNHVRSILEKIFPLPHFSSDEESSSDEDFSDNGTSSDDDGNLVMNQTLTSPTSEEPSDDIEEVRNLQPDSDESIMLPDALDEQQPDKQANLHPDKQHSVIPSMILEQHSDNEVTSQPPQLLASNHPLARTDQVDSLYELSATGPPQDRYYSLFPPLSQNINNAQNRRAFSIPTNLSDRRGSVVYGDRQLMRRLVTNHWQDLAEKAKSDGRHRDANQPAQGVIFQEYSSVSVQF